MRRNAMAALMFLAAALLASCGRGSQTPESSAAVAAVKAAVAPVSKSAIEVPHEAVGTLKSKTVSAIRSKLTAHITAVHVREGDVVETGTILVDLDDREVAAQVDKAEAALSEARKALDETSMAIDAASSAKTAADANKDLAQATYDRYRGLFDSSAVSRQMLDEADAKRKSADADASRAADMLRSIEARRGEAQARIEQAAAEVANVRVGLGFAKIAAPMSGVVTKKNVDVGDLASPGAVLFEIEDNQQYRLEANVDENQLGGLHVGDKVQVILDALAGAELAGVVAEIVPAVDPVSRTFLVKVDLAKDNRLRSGVFGRLHFASAPTETLTVPKLAVFDRGQLLGVYVVGGDNIARMRLIKTGREYGDRVEVLSGLDEGERIVVDNVAQVTDGCRIQGSN